MNQKTYDAYVQILKDELLVATGCTEPIAIAAGRHPTKYAERDRRKKICGRILTTRCYTDDAQNYIRALADLSSGNAGREYIYIRNAQTPRVGLIYRAFVYTAVK